jgi:hypothetical protein
VITNNATDKGSAVTGAVPRGELHLAGLLRGGNCGRKLYVGYCGKPGRYYCRGALVNHGKARCISLVDTEVLRVLKQLGIDAAVKALTAQTSEISAAQRQLEPALRARTWFSEALGHKGKSGAIVMEPIDNSRRIHVPLLQLAIAAAHEILT